MTTYQGIERRDPYAPIIQLGQTLFNARQNRDSGWIEVVDNGQTNLVRLTNGAITQVKMFDSHGPTDYFSLGSAHRVTQYPLGTQAARLFALKRPNVSWTRSSNIKNTNRFFVDPAAVVLNGLNLRQNLIDPQNLVERIPVDTLHVPEHHLDKMKPLQLSSQELAFLRQLVRPTPISMILWKRGLAPNHAGALLLGLNLIGVWQDQWTPGLLPKTGLLVQILKKVQKGYSDLDLLGLSDNASNKEIDRKFRLLSKTLHPDRYQQSAQSEVQMAETAFSEVSNAYHRLKITRRSRPVRQNVCEKPIPNADPIGPENWFGCLNQARIARNNGQNAKAKAFALKALSLAPPPEAKAHITQFLKVA